MSTQTSQAIKEHTPSSVSLFEYIVAKLVGIGEMPPKSTQEYNEELKQYNMTRYMKTLYFLCLASCCVIRDEEGINNQSTLEETRSLGLYKKSLFRLFKFTTFPNGPVEQSIYAHMRTPERRVHGLTIGREIKMKTNNENESRESVISKGILMYEDKFGETVDLVKKSLKYLFGGEYTPYSQKQESGSDLIKYKEIDTQMLIDVSHSFPTWRAQKDDRLRDLKGAEAIFAFIKENRLEKNMSRHLEEGANLMAEIRAFEEFRRG